MKRPSFQFYPGDWLRSANLRACSLEARGLWIDMLCLMHEGYPYGYLRVGNLVIHAVNLAPIVGRNISEVERWLSELSTAGVFSTDSNGCIFSRRMVRDERVRETRARSGKLGGNPTLIKHDLKDDLKPDLKRRDKQRVNQLANQLVKPIDKQASNQKPTLASASAFIKPRCTTTNNETRAPAPEGNVQTSGPDGPNGNGQHPPPDDWWITSTGIAAKGAELGMKPEYRETDRAFKDRIFKALQQRKATP